ncbi:MAG: S8 family peptidase [Chloroflexi bacterium]|nr:S8 family peptidase [Chloroflexota bacterium]
MGTSRLVHSFIAGLLLAGAVASLGADTPSRKIVVFKEFETDEVEHEDIIARAGATKIKHLRLINGAVVLAGRGSHDRLARHGSVRRVEDDVEAQALGKLLASQPAEQLPWGVNRIDAELAWATNTGAGIKVAVVDTGIDLSHPDLAANIKGGVNTINPSRSAKDDNGHGSHVAGTIAAVDNSIGVVGVAPKASLYAVKVLGSSGSGWVSDIIEGIQWSVQNGMQVVNMSLGTSSDVVAFHDALTAAYNAGILLVAAAGNSGPGDFTVNYPAKYAEVIAVSATTSSDAIASYSSRGPEVELAAPGTSVYSTYRGGRYATLSGTSMATPHVSGAAALALARGLSRDEARAALQATADDLGSAGRDNLFGYGLVDAEQVGTGL